LITNLIQEKTLMKEYMFMIYTMKVHQLFTWGRNIQSTTSINSQSTTIFFQGSCTS
jgi:hypothetical protein